MSDDIAKARKAIEEELRGSCKDEQAGAIDCPRCGKAMAFVADEGRIHAACSTKNCINWADKKPVVEIPTSMRV